MRFDWIRLVAMGIAGALAVAMSLPAQAQATRTWVSGVGDDANPCSRTAPCKTFAGAISKTATNGEINCLDPGGFGAVTIVKSISIVCDSTVGGVLASGTNGINVNVPANAIVTLKGLDIECVGTGLNGINVLGTGSVVHVHKTQIRNCRGSNGSGITVVPTAGTTDLYVADSYITDNGSSSTTGGITLKPTGSANVNVTINRTQLENNTNGLRADTSAVGATGFIRGVVRDSLVGGSGFNGIAAITNTSVTSLMVDKVTIVNNATGLNTTGAQSQILVTDSSVTANDNGIVVTSGAIISYKNNSVNGNIISDGTFTLQITPQ